MDDRWYEKTHSTLIVEQQFIDRLSECQLFQGLTLDDYISINERVHFDFDRIAPGATIVEDGDPCEYLICTLSGVLRREERCDNGSYTFRERFSQPLILQPERLFGLRQRYSASFIAENEVKLLRVSRHDVRDVLFGYMPFHFNFFNHICTNHQLAEARFWRPMPGTLEQRFLHFLLMHSTRPAGHKELVVDMIALAGELVTTRLRVSQMLNNLKERGLIQLRRRHIIVPSLETFIQNAQ